MAADLKFNIQKLNEMKTYVDEAVTSISAKRDLAVTTLQILQNDWNTDAGKEFKKNVDFKWTDEVSKYLTVMRTVSSLLGEAATKYATVQETVESLDFSIEDL